MALKAKLALLGLRGVQVKQLAELGVIGVGDVAGGGTVAILALIPGKLGRFLLGFPPGFVFESGGVAGDTFGVKRRVGLGVLQESLERVLVLGLAPLVERIGMAVFARRRAGESCTGRRHPRH